MELLSGIEVEDSLVDAFLTFGRRGHEIALAHHNDPGSNGHTFGSDRYHRSCELLIGALESHGFKVRHKGAGMRARRDDIELHFATAKTEDVTAPASFDHRTDARLEAARKNSQLPLDGLDDKALPPVSIVHVVWSGNSALGLIAVHSGRLLAEASDRVEWGEVKRLDNIEAGSIGSDELPAGFGADYAHIPVPELELEAVPTPAAAGEERTSGE